MKTHGIKKVVLAYSGGLDTSVILTWIKENYGCEVITFTADIGQAEELDGLEAKALKTGATKAYITDLRDEFVRDFVFPAFRAGAVYEGEYLLGTSLARPLIGKHLAAIAARENADAIAHGATGKGNDQVRFELTAFALMPGIRVVAPWREWEFKSRSDLIAYAQTHGIPVPTTAAKPYSTDRNLLHISFEGGILEDPWAAPPEDMFLLTTSPEKAPDRPTEIVIAFEAGNPVAIDGHALGPSGILAQLNRLGGENGIGRADIVENRFVGMKSRGVYETPGGTILFRAHRAMESLTLDRQVMHLRDSLIPRYSELVYNGFWYDAERELLQTLVDETQRYVTGEVRVRLYKGNVAIVGRRSPHSLFDPGYATFEADTVYNQADATGFIRLNALRSRIRTLARGARPS